MRHFVANPTMSSLGHHAGGVVGFLKNLQLMADKVSPSSIVVIWEGGGAVRRRAIYPEYKAGKRAPKLNRFYEDDIPDSQQNKTNQVATVISLLKEVPVRQVYVSDCEADDVIGYLAKKTYKDDRCVIVSSDKDYYQLLTDRVIQWSPGQKKFVTAASLKEKFNISAVNFCTARCFVGDPADNISGIKGVGLKTLSKRFPMLETDDFVSINDILNLSRVHPRREKIKLYNAAIAGEHLIRRNWKLMYLDTNNLAASQIQKIDSIIDTFHSTGNKISLIRKLLREGLNMFDADSFYMSINSVLYR